MSAFRYHLKPAFWIVVFVIATIAAYCTLQQITFVPGVPLRGYLEVYALLLVLWSVAILAIWFVVQVLRFMVHRARGLM